MSRFFFSAVCVAALTLFSIKVHSQNNFQPGKVVMHSGDSLSGMIDDQLWRENPTTILFKDQGGNTKSFAATDIDRFSVSNKEYESMRLRYDSSGHSRKPTTSSLPQFKTSHVFAELLIRGPITLYRFEERNNHIHYIVSTGGNIQELVNHEYEHDGLKQTNKTYISQLKSIMSDCSSVSVSDHLRYEQQSLTKIVEQYNQCKGSSSVRTKTDKHIDDFGVAGSISSDQLGGSSAFAASMGYGVMGFWNHKFPGRLYRWSIYSELGYRKFGDQKNEAKPYQYEISSLKLTIMGRRHFNVGGARAFYNLGLGYSMGLTDENKYLTTNRVTEIDSEFISGVIGLGSYINYKSKGPRVILDARFEYGSGGNFDTTVTKHSCMALGVAIEF
ncbi:hypothetical protein WBG78_26215 [Chryseolinea sp. T2]|uniref:hypothetical protein n=1 Tax=Chryseolinea sp. T2 TaxID=3129255 RepID=UPI0030769564